jgi:hypothetical protein
MAKIDCTFHRTSNHNVEVHSPMGDFRIMKMKHEYEDIKKAGFLKSNKEPAYKVSSVCDSLVTMLNLYNESGQLTGDVFNNLINAYRPFILNYMVYAMINQRVKEAKNPEGWLDA